MEHLSKSKVIVSRQDWLLWQRENAVKKECQDRLKNTKSTPLQKRIYREVVLQNEPIQK